MGFYNTNAEDVFDNSPEVNDHFEANGFCEIIVSKLDDNIQINDVNFKDILIFILSEISWLC